MKIYALKMNFVIILILLASLISVLIDYSVCKKELLNSQSNAIINDYPAVKCEETLDYNKETDDFVNDKFNNHQYKATTNKLTYFDEWHFTFRFDDCQFIVVLEPFREFERKEIWHFMCYMKDGTPIMIESSLGLKHHTISQQTYSMLKSKCIDLINDYQ